MITVCVLYPIRFNMCIIYYMHHYYINVIYIFGVVLRLVYDNEIKMTNKI